MAKLRLVGWMVATGVSAVVLLRGLSWSSEDAAMVVMGAVRAVAGLLALYLFLVTLLAVRLPRLAPRFVARLVAGALGTGLLVVPLTASAEPRPRPPAEAPVLRRMPGPVFGDARAPEVAPRHHQNQMEVVVAPGEHIWSIAERVLGERLGRMPTDDEIIPFWREVIVLNHELDDPDLVFAGQVLRLPS